MVVENVSKDSMVQSFRRAADLEERQQEVAINLLQTLSVPICLFVTLQVVAFAMIALFLPLLKLITELSG
jgi:type II secretory pathway component PulF